MKLYPVFLLMATATVFSPGPGVVMTLSNALRFGWRSSFGGILGIACGALLVATISATSLGVVLATSAFAFSVMKLLGAGYLLYLAFKLWRSPPPKLDAPVAREGGLRARFLAALWLQLTNPKAIVFFLSVFPQFIEADAPYVPQFVLLVLSYALLVVVIHCGYALTAQRARQWLATPRGGVLMNRVSAACFLCFGAMLATAKR